MDSKVLCLLHMPPPNYGVTIINNMIANDILKKSFDVDIVTINTAKLLDQIGKVSFGKIIGLIKVWLKLLFKLSQNRYDFCYFTLTPTGVGFYKDFCLVFLLKIFGVKTIFHLHGKGLSDKDNARNAPLYNFCFKGNKVIILSQVLREDIAKYVDEKNIYILPNGIKECITDEYFQAGLSERNNNRINILFLSNMVRSKGVFDALSAAKILKDKGCNFTFNFIGGCFDITDKEFMDKVRNLELEELVHYQGFKSGEGKNKAFMQADIFVYPTFNDTFPLVLLEAMEFGLPIVSTYEGAIPEIVEDGKTGFLVSKRDSQSLAEKINNLIDDENLRKDMGHEAREKFLSQYTFSTFSNNLIKIFHSVTNQ